MPKHKHKYQTSVEHRETKTNSPSTPGYSASGVAEQDAIMREVAQSMQTMQRNLREQLDRDLFEATLTYTPGLPPELRFEDIQRAASALPDLGGRDWWESFHAAPEIVQRLQQRWDAETIRRHIDGRWAQWQNENTDTQQA
jgi:hypothetical protein